NLLAQEEESRRKLTGYIKEEKKTKQELAKINEIAAMSESEREERIDSIREKLDARNLKEEDRLRLQEEMDLLLDVEQGKHVETVEKLQEKLAKQSENVEKEQEKLDKLSEEKQLMIDMELTNVGINEQGA